MRSTFASSRAASTSSRMQKGEGFDLKMAISRATVVRVFSPPLSRLTERVSFPGGRARMSMPLSRTSSGLSRTRSALPPPNSLRKSSWKFVLTAWNVSAKRFAESSSSFKISS